MTDQELCDSKASVISTISCCLLRKALKCSRHFVAAVHRHVKAEGIQQSTFIAIFFDIFLFAQICAIKIEIKVAKLIEIHAMKSVFIKE